MQRRPLPSSSQAQLYELNKQVQEKRRALLLAQEQNQSDTLTHYRNFNFGGSSSDQPDIQDFLKKQPTRPSMAPYMQADPRSIPLSSNISFNKPDHRTFASVGRDMLFGQQASTPSAKMSAFEQSVSLAAPAAQQPGQKHETERDRRLRLRELERQRQKAGGGGSIYGDVEDLPVQPPSAPLQAMNPPSTLHAQVDAASFQPFAQPAGSVSFGQKREQDAPPSASEGSSRKSRREELWELKKQKRMNSFGAPEEPTQGGMFNQQVAAYPEKAQRRAPLIPPSAKTPNSPPKRPISAIQKARQLDKEINHAEGQPQSPPSGLLQFPGERYEENRRKMQEQIANEYKQFSAARANSIGRRDSRPLEGQGASLALQGFNHKSAEEKARAQQEYRRELLQQQQQRKQSAGVERRQQIADDVFSEIMQSRGSQRAPPPPQEFQRANYAPQPQRIEFQTPQAMAPQPVPTSAPLVSQQQQQLTLDQIEQRKRELASEINPSSFPGAVSQRSEGQAAYQAPLIRAPSYGDGIGGGGRGYAVGSEQPEQEGGWQSKITSVQLPPEEQKKRNQQRDEYRAFLEKQMKEKEEKKAREETLRKAQEEKEEREAIVLQERLKQQREMELGRAVPQQAAPVIAPPPAQRAARLAVPEELEEYPNKIGRGETGEASSNFVRFKVENMKDEVEISKREEKARKQKIWQEELRKQMEERDREKKQKERAQKEEEERLERKLQKERELLERQQAYELRVEKWKNAVKRKEQGEEVAPEELEEPAPPAQLYVPAKVTQRKNQQMFMTSEQIQQQREQHQLQKEQWSAPAAPPEPIQFSRAREVAPPAPAEDPFTRQELASAEEKQFVAGVGGGFQAAKAKREDLFSAPGSENQNIMNVGHFGGGREQMGEVERMRYETEMKLLQQEKQKLEEQMLWKQREQQMRDQMFQMMVMMQAGGKVDPQELMKQYFVIQQQMNPNANLQQQTPPFQQQPLPQTSYPQPPAPQFNQPAPAPSFEPPQSLGFSGSQRSLTGSRGRIPTLESQAHPDIIEPATQPERSREVFQVQTQFHQLPQILHQGGTLPQPTDRSDCTLPQSNTFIPHSEMPSVNSSAFQNLHAKLDQEELEKSLTSETKLIAAVANTEGRLRKKLKELQHNADTAMMNSAMMSETWVPSEKRGDMPVEEHQPQTIAESSHDRFDTFRQNMKDINEQMERLDQNLQKKQSESASYEDRESIKTESVKSGTGTFNFQNTGQYSPMSTDKRQTFYDQIKSLELTESQLPVKQDVTVVSEAAAAEESFTDYAASSYIQKNMREIEERVEKELKEEGYEKKIRKTPTIKSIAEAEGTYEKEQEDIRAEERQSRVERKSWSKQGAPQAGELKAEHSEERGQEERLADEGVMVQDASGTLQKLMEEMAKGYEREEEINIACTSDALLPPEALELMKGKIEQDRRSIEEANKRFQSSARVGGDVPSWLKNEPGVLEESTTLKRPNTGIWMPQVQTSQDLKAQQSIEESMAEMRKEVQRAVDSANRVPMRRVSRSAAKVNKKLTEVEEELKANLEHTDRSEQQNRTAEESASSYNLAIGESTLQAQAPQVVAQSVYGGEKFKLCLDSDEEPYEAKMAQTGMESTKSKESLKGMRLHSLRDLRDQVKRSQNRDTQIYEGLEKHVKELEEQVMSSKGFEKTKRSEDEAESPSLRFDHMIDKMIAQFQPPDSLTKDL